MVTTKWFDSTVEPTKVQIFDTFPVFYAKIEM